MRFVEITTEKIDLNDSRYGETRLFQGKTYLIHDALAQAIVNRNWGKLVGDNSTLSHLPREVLRQNNHPLKILILFEGGLGDAVSAAILFVLLGKKYNLKIDVVCRYDAWHYVFVPMGFCGRRLDFPVDIDEINRYDYIQTDLKSFIRDHTGRWDRCIMEELALAYGIDPADFHGSFSIPPDTIQAMHLPEGNKVRIGVNFESKGRIRNYPDELGVALISALIGLGFEVYRFGVTKTSQINGLRSNAYLEYCGRTNIFELAALLKQMDLVVGVDSFPVHLSNILGVRTMALLSTTMPGIYRCYENVLCLNSQIECTPCGEVMDTCPEGHKNCMAFYHASISPERIIDRIIRECACLFKNKFKAA